MPYYPYKCDNCGHTLEVEQKITEKPKKICPKCKKKTLRRQISDTVSFSLVGDGWASSGYK